MTARSRILGLSRVVAVLLFVAPLVGEAQQAERVYRIGFLSAATAPVEREAFRQGLGDHGYVEGRDLLIEWRSGEGRSERLAGFAAELVRLKVEVIVTSSTSAAIAAKKATTSIPIVFTLVSDPVATGLVAGLARPGGNITGFATLSPETTGKRLELFKEAVPSLKSVTVLYHTDSPMTLHILKESRDAGRKLGLDVRLLETRDSSDLERTLMAMARGPATGVVLVPGAFIFTHQTLIVQFAMKGRLPVLGWQRQLAESGALISYGPTSADIVRQAAKYVDRILKGAKPSDLPVEQPTKFQLVINAKTAKALGLTIPRSLLLRADEIIQ